ERRRKEKDRKKERCLGRLLVVLRLSSLYTGRESEAHGVYVH
ncbi:hypothetical protein CSUI_011163, partial [Cystoisospora suis]